MATPSEIKTQAEAEAKKEAKLQALRKKELVKLARTKAKCDAKRAFPKLEEKFAKAAAKRLTEYAESFFNECEQSGREYLLTFLDELEKLCNKINVKMTLHRINYNTHTEYEGLMDPCPIAWNFVNYSVYVIFSWK